MSTTYARERTLQEEIAPAVERRLPGVEVLAVELLSPSRFCVYVDHPNGVDHALCEQVTYVLDEYRREYTVDVSSPGPERPLRTQGHFQAVVGRVVALRTANEIDGRKRFRGTVTEAGENAVTLDVADVGAVRVPYDAIVRGNLIDERLEP
jgi:ribosome maturation factor RimP